MVRAAVTVTLITLIGRNQRKTAIYTSSSPPRLKGLRPIVYEVKTLARYGKRRSTGLE